jgi:hypothetical protein
MNIENICSNNGGAQKKGKTVRNSVYHQNRWFSEFHHPVYDQIQCSGVLFSYFMDNSDVNKMLNLDFL